MKQDHDAQFQSQPRSPHALNNELSEEELEKVSGGGTLVGNPGKLERAFRDLLISSY
jgi:bacteriocin-like protein